MVATLAESYLSTAVKGAGAVAELAASRKTQKYSELAQTTFFNQLLFMMPGPSSASEFISILANLIADTGSQLSYSLKIK